MGELTLQARLRIRNLTLSAGWMGLRENNEEWEEQLACGNHARQRKATVSRRGSPVEEGQGQEQREIPRIGGKKLKELTLGGLPSRP